MIDLYQPLMMMAAWLLYDRFDYVPIGGGDRRKEKEECASVRGKAVRATALELDVVHLNSQRLVIPAFLAVLSLHKRRMASSDYTGGHQ